MIDYPILRAHLVASTSENPYLLHLGSGEDLSISRLVREVPNKRLVCQAQWQGQAVYVKLFFGRDAQRYAERDKNGVAAWVEANILTPKLLYAYSQDCLSLLVFEAIIDSQSAESLWPELNATQRLSVARSLARTVGQHHHSNLIQTDLHLKNFLIADTQVYAIDGDGIRQFKCLSCIQALRNFSIFLAKLDVLEIEAWLPQLLDAYYVANPKWLFSLQKLKWLSAYYRRKAATHYADKKVLRTCTDVQVVQTHHAFFAFSNAYRELTLPNDIAAYDSMVKEAALLKAGRTCTVGLMQNDGLAFVIKRYNIKGIAHKIGRFFRKTRAEISWSNAHRLQLLGFSTHKPIALVEQRMFALRGKAYFLSEYIDAPDIAQYFTLVENPQQRALAIEHVVQLFYRLYLLNISHGDMKATNIKMVNDIAVLIDLDSMQQHTTAYFAKKNHVRDLKRFMQNWKADTSLYNAFRNAFEQVYKNDAAKLLAKIST